MRVLKLLIVLPMVLGLRIASADPIYYEAENLGGNTWRYDYTVANDTGAPIDWFTIFFDPLAYAFEMLAPAFFEVDPSIVGNPDGWDILVAAPDPFFPGSPDDQSGFYDGFALFAPPIAPGESLGGFSIEFEWLGAGTPGSQPFTLGGLGLGEGPARFTEPFPTVSVSEPGTLLLLATGLAALARRRRSTSAA